MSLTYADLMDYLSQIPKRILDTTQVRIDVDGRFHQGITIKTNMHGLKKPHIVIIADNEKHGLKVFSIKSSCGAYIANYCEAFDQFELTVHYDYAEKLYSLKEARKILKALKALTKTNDSFKIVSRRI